MQRKVFGTSLALAIAVSILYTPLSGISQSYAADELITDTQLTQQHNAVLLGFVGVLQEQVKFMQMVLIRKLEAQVDVLQTRVNAMQK